VLFLDIFFYFSVFLSVAPPENFFMPMPLLTTVRNNLAKVVR